MPARLGDPEKDLFESSPRTGYSSNPKVSSAEANKLSETGLEFVAVTARTSPASTEIVKPLAALNTICVSLILCNSPREGIVSSFFLPSARENGEEEIDIVAPLTRRFSAETRLEKWQSATKSQVDRRARDRFIVVRKYELSAPTLARRGTLEDKTDASLSRERTSRVHTLEYVHS